MLDRTANELLTRVGPGTATGDLLRRYWMPIAAVSEFEQPTIRPVRLMGEDLILYRDLGGNLGLVARHCPHRRADMLHGFLEPCGLRCHYHGWLFDCAGRCMEQPYDDLVHPDAHFRDRVTTAAYPVQTHAGLIWAYLGPEPRPLIPNWEPFTWPNGFVQIVFAQVPCNWLQCQENSIDPAHFEWAHMNWSTRLAGKPGPYSPRHLKLEFEEFEYGFTYRRLREGMPESDPLWTIGRVCLWPNMLFTGNHFEWRVPVDDENTLSVTWSFSRVPREREPYIQQRIPAWHGPVKDAAGNFITSHIMNQDFAAWAGQGVIADRSKEHLGASDRGIILQRKRFIDDIAGLNKGREPKAVVRDPELNRCIELPIADRQILTHGLPLAELQAHPIYGRYLDDYPYQAGQPAEVRREFREAMGLPAED